jgi:hypothetical protein
MRSDQWSAVGQPPTLDLDAPPSTYRISVDVDMLPAGMASEQACGLLVAALEAAHMVRAVRVNQCSTLTKDGMHRQDCDGSVSKITP